MKKIFSLLIIFALFFILNVEDKITAFSKKYMEKTNKITDITDLKIKRKLSANFSNESFLNFVK